MDGFIDMVDMVIILMLGYAMQECMYAMGMEDFVSAVCGAIPVASLRHLFSSYSLAARNICSA